MLLTYERGDAQRPKGTLSCTLKLVGSSSLFATYLIVPNLGGNQQYIPPMFAGNSSSSVPRINVSLSSDSEKVQVGLLSRWLKPDDDLIFGIHRHIISERLLHAAAEAANQYFQSFILHSFSPSSGDRSCARGGSRVRRRQ